MLFRKYHIVVFKDNEGVCRKLRCRGLTLFTLVSLFLGLIAGNVYFWKYYVEYATLSKRLQSADKTVEEQKNQLLSLAGKLKSVEKDLTRIRDFDSKLRVMMNLEHVETTTAIGGPDKKDFSSDYLPVYRQEMLARRMHDFLHQLNTDIRLEEVQQQELIQAIRVNEDILTSTPSIWPVEGWVSSGFGYRKSPFTGKKDFHKGVDISGRIGTPIYATAKGSVAFAGVDRGYGKTVVLDHGNGIMTRYAHMHRISVKKGQPLNRGDLVGQLGNSGRSTGPHTHYEVRLNGVCVNPMRYILN